jgi:hypothetical protein
VRGTAVPLTLPLPDSLQRRKEEKDGFDIMWIIPKQPEESVFDGVGFAS